MSKTLRHVVFAVFLVAFLVSAPLVVLYTAGYRIDFANARIVHTAVLNITSSPRNATVWIDGEPEEDRTPSIIDTILPGERHIELTRDKYLSWSERLVFESSEARIIGPIVLFLNNAFKDLVTLNITDYALHPKEDLLAYITHESSWAEVWQTSGAQEETALVMRLSHDPNSDYTLEWAPDAPYLLLDQTINDTHEIHVAHAGNQEVELPDDLTRVDEFWWDVGNNQQLFVLQDKELFRVDLRSGSTEPLPFSADRVQSWQGQMLGLVTSNSREVLSFHDGETASIVTYLPLGNYEFVPAPAGLVSLYDQERERLVVIDVTNRTQPILLTENATMWKWNTDGTNLLYSTGFDLKMYQRSGHEFFTITRLSYPIDGLLWYPTGLSLFYQSNGTTTFLQLEDKGVISEHALANDLPGSLWLDKDAKTLFLIQEKNSGYVLHSRALQE